MLFQVLAVVCAGLFAGAAIYVSAVEHPARLACGTTVALREFGPSYRRGAVMQAALAIIGFVAAGLAWWQIGHVFLLIGGVLLAVLVPFTLLVILPINERLLDPRLPADSPDAFALLRRWGQMHAVRTVLGSLSFVLLAEMAFLK